MDEPADGCRYLAARPEPPESQTGDAAILDPDPVPFVQRPVGEPTFAVGPIAAAGGMVEGGEGGSVASDGRTGSSSTAVGEINPIEVVNEDASQRVRDASGEPVAGEP